MYTTKINTRGIRKESYAITKENIEKYCEIISVMQVSWP